MSRRISTAQADEWFERSLSARKPSAKVWKNLKDPKPDPKGPHCENCKRETDVLFDGFKEPEIDPKILTRFKGNLELARALSAPFMTQPARVCIRCRPPSNLEIKELVQQSSQQERHNRLQAPHNRLRSSHKPVD